MLPLLVKDGLTVQYGALQLLQLLIYSSVWRRKSTVNALGIVAVTSTMGLAHVFGISTKKYPDITSYGIAATSFLYFFAIWAWSSFKLLAKQK
jgi:hypothetical protein